MDRTTIYTKTAKGMMEATGKTSVLSRDMRALLKEIDGKATVGDVQAKLGKVPQATLQEALKALAKNDFIREFKQPQTVAPPTSPAGGDFDLDFTMAIPTVASLAKKAEEEARQKAEAARAQAEAEARAKQEAEARAKTAAVAAQAAARAKAEAEAKARSDAEARAKDEAEARAKREAEERARKEAEDRARKEAEEQARREADALRAKLEDERKAREDAERKAKAEAERERKEAEDKARREADELRARLEEERRAREDAERRAKENAARERKEAEEKARREADELRARLDEERRVREESERKAKEQAERERKEAEEKARREADELRARLEEERQAREAAERRAKEDAERREQEEAERKAREDAERQLRDEAERKAREDAERARKEAEESARREADELRARLEQEHRAREEAERKAQEEAERRAREDAERKAREAAERQRREAEDAARREAEEQARKQEEARALAREQERIEAEARARKEIEEAERRAEEAAARKAQEETTRRERGETERQRREADAVAKEQERKAQDEVERGRREAAETAARASAAQQPAEVKSGSKLEDLVRIETDFDAVLGAGGGAAAATSLPGAADKLRKEAEAEQARLQAEEKAEAEEQARVQADAAAKRDADERLRREDEERQQADAMDDASDLAAAQAREHAEALAALEAQDAETERHFAEMEKELESEQAMAGGGIQPSELLEGVRAHEQEDARERVRAAAAAQAVEAEREAERAPPVYRQRINWGKPVAIGLFLLLLLGLISVHFVSFDAYIPQFEKLAAAHMQQPVKIKALHLSLVPQPHWRLDGVSVGTESQLVVPRINAITELGSMFAEKKVFTSIELESPVVGDDGLLALLFGKAAGQDMKVAKISVKNGKLDSKTIILPALDAKIAFGEDGAWRQIALETPDHKTSLLLKPEGEGAQLEVETNAFSLPFHPAFILENMVAKGTIRRGELKLSEFKGGIYGGYLSGNANLKWGAGWSLGGEIDVRAMEPARFAPVLMEEGKLEGKAQYAMRAKSYDELFVAPRLEGSFTVMKGTLLGVDLARLLQGGGVGGKTAFTELTGGFVREAGKTQLRQMLLVAGPVSAGGSAEVDTGKRINGRFAVEIKSPVAKARANFAVAGTLSEPRFSRQ